VNVARRWTVVGLTSVLGGRPAVVAVGCCGWLNEGVDRATGQLRSADSSADMPSGSSPVAWDESALFASAARRGFWSVSARSLFVRTWPVVAILGGCCVAAAWEPNSTGPVMCPLRATTGVWCPGCGMTRAALSLGRLELPAAWRYHPWVFALAAQFLLFALLRAVHTSRGAVVLAGWNRRAQTVIWANLGALVAVWAVRYVTGAIPLVGG
jgi:hypothetical protein